MKRNDCVFAPSTIATLGVLNSASLSDFVRHPLPLAPDGVVAETVERYVMSAHENPGSWRSDSGEPSRDLDRERHRWELVRAGSEAAVSEDVRKNFLFEDCFRQLVSAMN